MSVSTLSYDEIIKELQKLHLILIDVREKEELKIDGKIEQSKNIPVGELGTALKLDIKSFKEAYGFEKPGIKDDIVVHCKAGMRAQNGAKALIDAGYENVRVYPGIMDWKSHGGSVV